GGKPVREAGGVENARVDEVYGLHLTTQDKTGTVNVRRGPTMASGDGFNVEVTGKGGHGAYPHLSVDPMTAAAHILIGMQSLVTKEVAAKETVVLTVGQLQAGAKDTILPDKAVMRGTLRTFDLDVREQLLGRLQSFVSDMARAYRAEARMDLTMGCPPVINPEKETELVRTCCVDELGPSAVVENHPV